MPTKIYITDPIEDSRWDAFASHHLRASAFHQAGWLRALSLTYGYPVIALTSTPPGEPLRTALVFCRVSSWMTGTRLVSLPFADHCDPLLDSAEAFAEFATWLQSDLCDSRSQYVELRPTHRWTEKGCGFEPHRSFYFHELDLRRPLSGIFDGLHKDCIQRKIRRAEREKLSYEAGRSDELLDAFYRLLLSTRRRLHLLPQPRRWFRNLIECMGEKVQVRVASHHGTPVAALLTLQHGPSVIYKYGCSEQAFHRFGGMPFLFWRLIEESKASGMEKIDLGRSDLDSTSLVLFKDRLGAAKKQLTYYRYSRPARTPKYTPWNSARVRQLFSILPDAVCSTAGSLLYRHIG